MEQDKPDGGDHKAACNGQLVGVPHPWILPGAVVKPDDRLGALGQSDEESQQDCICLHDDAACGQWDIFSINSHGAIIGQRVIHDHLDQSDSYLIQTVAHAESGRGGTVFQAQPEMFPAEPDTLEFPEVKDGCQEREELSDDGCPGSAGNAKLEHENKNGIQDGVEDGADQHTGHGIPGTAVCTNQAAHTGSDDLERHTKGNNAGIGGGIGQILRSSSKSIQHRIKKEFDQYCIDEAKKDHHADTVSTTRRMLFLFAGAKT